MMTSLFLLSGYETSEDKVYKEPLLTDLDEPPPASVILADPAPMASITLECSEPTYTEYPEPGQPPCAGGLVCSRFKHPGVGLSTPPP